jgi:opacity protein-like surface antigen
MEGIHPGLCIGHKEEEKRTVTKILKMLAMGLCFIVFTVVSPWAHAEDGSSGKSTWEFHVVPYIWMAGISGDVTVKGSRTSVDESFSDILENLDFGGFLHLEAAKGKWAFFGDGTYVKLSVDRTLIDVGSEQVQVELGGAYRFAQLPLGKEGGRLVSFEALAGGRYNYVKSEVKILRLLKSKESQDWVDPIVGVRFTAGLTEKLSLRVRGDIGGFGIGSASDFAWNVVAVLGYQLSRRITLGGGWRILDIDYERGSGRRRFEYDVTTSGPVLGLAFRF